MSKKEYTKRYIKGKAVSILLYVAVYVILISIIIGLAALEALINSL